MASQEFCAALRAAARYLLDSHVRGRLQFMPTPLGEVRASFLMRREGRSARARYDRLMPQRQAAPAQRGRRAVT